MNRLEIRGLPAALFRRYLQEEFDGRCTGDGSVEGDGWRARFIDGTPLRIGLVMTPVLFVEFDGERAAEASAFVARKAMRGGG